MQLRTELEIAAAPEQIWNTLVDFRSYPEWNPLIVSASGQLIPGRNIEVCISLPENGKTFRFRPLVTKHEPPFQLAWVGTFGPNWLFSGHHFFELRQQGPSSTRLVHGEDFSGVLTKFMGHTFTLTGRGFAYMNQALKERVEARAKSVQH